MQMTRGWSGATVERLPATWTLVSACLHSTFHFAHISSRACSCRCLCTHQVEYLCIINGDSAALSLLIHTSRGWRKKTRQARFPFKGEAVQPERLPSSPGTLTAAASVTRSL